jgi:hypothetical protein
MEILDFVGLFFFLFSSKKMFHGLSLGSGLVRVFEFHKKELLLFHKSVTGWGRAGGAL